MVILSIFTAATPVGISNRTLGLSGLPPLDMKFLVTAWLSWVNVIFHSFPYQLQMNALVLLYMLNFRFLYLTKVLAYFETISKNFLWSMFKLRILELNHIRIRFFSIQLSFSLSKGIPIIWVIVYITWEYRVNKASIFFNNQIIPIYNF